MINCLTYEQLQAYSVQQINNAEREYLYKHISTCDMCSCAVNGFASNPFSFDELSAIHSRIDEKANATAANSLTFAQFFIVLASLIAIMGVYRMSDHPIVVAKPKENTQLISININTNETKKIFEKEIPAVKEAAEKNVVTHFYVLPQNTERPAELFEIMEPKAITSVELSSGTENPEVISIYYNRDVLYINDLKVADYTNLYEGQKDSYLKENTPAHKENKNAVEDDFGVEQGKLSADGHLRQGLLLFGRQHFDKALEHFKWLLEKNEQDVNSQFYAALSYYNLDKNTKAVEKLTAVLNNSCNVFAQEAQWYLALATLKEGDVVTAQQLLQTIVDEKGFYEEKAKEKMKKEF